MSHSYKPCNMKRQCLQAPKPHSHVFVDGRFVPIATPTAKEQAAAFAQEVAKANLIQIANRRDKLDVQVEPQQQKQQPLIHPIARASGHIRSQCLGELSKAVNLAGLVLGGEYIELHHVLQNEEDQTSKDTADKKEGRRDTLEKSFVEPSLDPERVLLDSILRANFVLQRKQKTYSSCQHTLHRHATTCYAAVALYHSHINNHMLELRQRGWKLTLPLRILLDSSSSTRKRMISSKEIIAMQLNVYRVNPSSTSPQSSFLSKVPQFATVEITDQAVSTLSTCPRPTASYHRRHSKKRRVVTDSVVKKEEMQTHVQDNLGEAPSSPTAAYSPSLYNSNILEIRPLVWTGSTLTDTNMSGHNTFRSLVFQFEDTAHGHIVSQHQLSFASEMPLDQGQSDERILDALQHSLFCTQLFESLKNEVLQSSSSVHAAKGSAGVRTLSNPSTLTTLWLSKGVSDTGIPPPSLMMGHGKSASCVPGISLDDEDSVDILPRFTIVYCHEGEFKVLFNSKYTFVVTLQEYSLSRHAQSFVNTKQIEDDTVSHEYRRLSLILRLLLLHAQSIYHAYRKGLDGAASPSTSQIHKSIQESSPRILQSCLGLGFRCFLEYEIRQNLENIRKWLQIHAPEKDPFQVMWLPVSIMDLSSQCCISMGTSLCLDVTIVCDQIKVTNMNVQGEYQRARFYSTVDFDLFLKSVLSRALIPKGDEHSF